ncbi:hypothetical protein, partial [Escherichia coli]|uniref:hypothetical protein n=1 Tax=Escherichia coli TaxID=562 RepID=UPI001AD94F66
PAGPGSGNTAIAGLRFRFAPPPTGNGGGDDNALTISPDHPVGAANFFPTITENRIIGLLTSVGLDQRVAEIVARLA